MTGRWIIVLVCVLFSACALPEKTRLITLDPGHFHAALVQKSMHDGVSPLVRIYGPDGPDIMDHLNRIQGFNTRKDNPTSWKDQVYKGEDFLETMLQDKAGDLVIISGNNRNKAKYIKSCVEAGLNVLADKPMCIDKQGCELIEEAFALAEKKGLLLYDIMTERSEITTILQKELSLDKELFGTLLKGSKEEPSIVKESVHHFFKYVAGNRVKRPAWFIDSTQQGEGVVDVTTHLVDLTFWECFPNTAIDFDRDIQIISAKRWPTLITREQFENFTRIKEFPDFLKEKLDKENNYPCYCNGEIHYTIRGVHAKVLVMWNYQAPEGAKDTHYSVLRGSKARVIIRQGKEENYRPELYVDGPEEAVRAAVTKLKMKYPGVDMEANGKLWRVTIPDAYRIGHEAHFKQVMDRTLRYLKRGGLPFWEIPNMITKYRITSGALELALKDK